MSKSNEDKDMGFEYKEEKYKGFSEGTQKFIEAMCYMATIGSEKLDKHEINTEIKTIQAFIKNCQSANNSVNNMFGFKEEIGELEFGTKKYYFFIADIKIKSAVYLLRIDNFLKSWEDFNSIEKRREAFLSSIENMRISDLKIFFQIFKETRYDQNKFSEIKSEEMLFREEFSSTFWKEDKSDENSEKKIALNIEEKIFEEFCMLIFVFLKKKNENDIKRISQIYKTQKEKILSKKDESKSNKEDELYELNGIISFDNAIELFSKTQNEQDTKSIEYYLFDNSMNEIDFCGIEWNWLWRYEQGTEDLFRCVGRDSFTYCGDYQGKNRRLYYQNMIKNIVNHMNKGGETKLASYSKNPFRDIYKYMISEYQDKNNSIDYSFKITVENNDMKAELIEKNNGRNAIKPIIFAMVKKANTNIIKQMLKIQEGKPDFKIGNNSSYSCVEDNDNIKFSFSKFVLGKDDAENEYNFCVDIFNTKEPYLGDVRIVFGRYTYKFPNVEVPNHQMSVVASSDNEVVMLGNTCNRIERNLLPKEEYNGCEENVEYRVELNRDEILYLFYKMHMLCNEEKVNIEPGLIFKEGEYFCNEIYVKFEENNTLGFVNEIKECIKKVTTEEKISSITELVNKDIYKQIVLSEEINKIIQNQDENLENGKKIEIIMKTVSAFEKNIREAIKGCIINKVKDISLNKIDFILSFLDNSEFKNHPNYGTATYKDGDADKLVALYRKLFLK